LFIDKYQTSMPKLTQWAEDNIPEGSLVSFNVGNITHPVGVECLLLKLTIQ
jgi:hypothetical protein